MRSKLAFGLLMAGLAVALAACGGPAPTPSGPVEVQVSLQEFTITSSLSTLQAGVPYHFVITNNGTIAHELVLEGAGVVDEPLEADGREGEVEEDELPPGATATLDWTFDTAGDYQMACHVPGHYEAGMVTTFTVQ